METTMDTLVAVTARPVTFCCTPYPGAETQVLKAPAGITVDVSERPRWLRIRIPGTGWVQDVAPSTLIVP